AASLAKSAAAEPTTKRAHFSSTLTHSDRSSAASYISPINIDESSDCHIGCLLGTPAKRFTRSSDWSRVVMQSEDAHAGGACGTMGQNEGIGRDVRLKSKWSTAMICVAGADIAERRNAGRRRSAPCPSAKRASNSALISGPQGGRTGWDDCVRNFGACYCALSPCGRGQRAHQQTPRLSAMPRQRF